MRRGVRWGLCGNPQCSCCRSRKAAGGGSRGPGGPRPRHEGAEGRGRGLRQGQGGAVGGGRTVQGTAAPEGAPWGEATEPRVGSRGLRARAKAAARRRTLARPDACGRQQTRELRRPPWPLQPAGSSVPPCLQLSHVQLGGGRPPGGVPRPPDGVPLLPGTLESRETLRALARGPRASSRSPRTPRRGHPGLYPPA